MLAEDALHNVEVLLCEIRAMIVRDSNVAAQVLRALEYAQNSVEWSIRNALRPFKISDALASTTS